MKGNEVNISAKETATDYQEYLILDIWLESKTRERIDLQEALEIIAATRNQIGWEVDAAWPPELTVVQEFIEVRLPKFLSQVSAAEAAAYIVGNRKVRTYAAIETSTLDAGWLKFGPEEPGSVEGLHNYLTKEASERPRDAVMASYRSSKILPFLIIAVMLGTWFFPLRGWSVFVISTVLISLWILLLYPARRVGIKTLFRQPETIASFSFLGIGAFGIGYALFGLFNGAALGTVDTLGYPFLVSTSLGVAGGSLGDPKGAIRVLIHIQLLLFLSGIIALIAVLLRIDRSVRNRG